MPLAQIVTRLQVLARLRRSILYRARGPVQRVASDAVTRLGKRWPLLAELLGDYVPFRTPSASQSSRTRAGATPAAASAIADAELVSKEPASSERASTELEASGLEARLEPRPAAGPEAGSAVDIDGLVRDLELGGDWAVRESAVRRLAAAGASGARNPQVTSALASALKDSSVEVATSAVEALGELGAPEGRVALQAVVDNEGEFFHPLVRAAAVRVLAEQGREEDAQRLYDALRDHDAEVSVSAIAAVAARDDRQSADYLLGLLSDESQFFLPITRLTAARALCRVSEVDGDKLAAILHAENDPSVRDALAQVSARA